MDSVVIALGGNSILMKGERPTFKVQFSHVSRTAEGIADMLSKHDVGLVITHGNGPQVGDELLRNELARSKIPKLPLFVLNAETQAFIGTMIEEALHRSLLKKGIKRDIVVVLTHTIVDPKDPAFGKPVKPIGPFYTKRELKKELKVENFNYVVEKGRYRRIVASPLPKQIVELKAISELVKEGNIVIAGGGGGIPVYRNNGAFIGVDAVIDKDYSTKLVANGIKAGEMVILTDIDYVYADYPKNKKAIKKVRATYLKGVLNSFERGTMAPKIEACMEFVNGGGKRAYIGNLFRLNEILDGTSGTMIVK